MRQFNSISLLAALTRAPFVREVPIPGSDKSLFVAEATVAVVTKRPNGSDSTAYLPITMTGDAARKLVSRFHEGQPNVLVIEGTFQRDTWVKDGKNMERLKIKALHTELANGEFPVSTDAKGGQRLHDGLNSAMIGGNLTADPEIRITPAGDKVTEISVAMNNRYVNRAGEIKEEVSFVRVTLWRDLAEKVAGLKKGAAVFITGAATSESWKDKEGNTQSGIKVEGYSVTVIATPDKVEGAAQTTTPAQPTEADLPPAEQSAGDSEDELPF